MIRWSFRSGVAAANAVGRLLGGVGVDPVRLEPDALCAEARRRTGLRDFGAWEYPDALAVACGSLGSEARLSPVGQIALREHLVLALATRLERLALRRERPERFGAALRPPLVVLGLPRSGTTFLHRLLVELPGVRGLRAWEIRRPFPPRRGAEARAALWALRALSPELDRKHVLDADAAEEEVGLFDSSLWTPSLWRLAAVRSYLSWYLAQDPAPAYRVFRELLCWFQGEDPSRRLALKLPNHLGFLDALLGAVPEALVVQTHRDPAAVIASYNSLMHSVHRAASDRVEPARTGRDGFEMWAELTDRCLAARDRLPPGTVYDVDYDALVADPEGVVRGIHRHFGLPWSEGHGARIRALAAERPRHQHGAHRYALSDSGLTRDEVHRRFATYLERHLGAPSPAPATTAQELAE